MARLGIIYTLIAAMLWNQFLPLFAVYNPAQISNASAAFSSVFGDKVLICTADGLKLYSLKDLQSGEEQPTPHEGITCPVCYFAAHGVKAFAPVHAFSLACVPHGEATKPVIPRAGPARDQVLSHSLHPRAPPRTA